jgi:hypothetical protein
MKQSVILILSALLLSVGCGTQDNGNNSGGGGNTGGNPVAITTPLPTATTAIGAPFDNDTVTASLDQTGGTLASPDGRLTLFVPAGALSAPATVGVGRISDRMPSGIGAGYRVTLTDDATQGKAALFQPLGLEFTLTDAELSGYDLTLENLAVAFQGAGGAWQLSPDAQAVPLGGVRVQSGVRPQGSGGAKITAKLKKAGDYALATRYKLHPRNGLVRVNDKLLLTILKFAPSGVDPVSGYANTNVTQIAASNWSVNGVAGGNSSVGLLIADSGDSQRTYKAPAKAPIPNPVRVSATVSDAGKTVTLVSKVRVEDSEGWEDIYADVTHSESKSFSNGGSSSLKINGVMQGKLDATDINVSAPGSIGGTNYDGILIYTANLDPNGSGTFSIVYTSTTFVECICTPKPGKAKKTITYEFTAADKPTPNPIYPANGGASIKSSGAYTLSGYVSLQLKGNYTLKVTETNPCSDKAPPPDVNESGEDTVAIGGQIKGEGSVKPQGPDRMTGSDTSYLTVALPASLPSGPSKPVKATVISNWYFDYAPPATQDAPAPLLPQSPPQTMPALPKEDAIVRPQC